MDINQKGLDLIKHFEGFRAKAYDCPAGVLTIGYGTTGSRVHRGMVIDQTTAQKWLLEDVRKFEDGVERLVKVKLTSNQFSALVSFAYNIGIGAFGKSTLLRKLNQGDYRGAAAEFDRWVKGGGRILPGLVRRRNAEEALFNEPDGVVLNESDIHTPKPVYSHRIQITEDTWFKSKTCSHSLLEENKEKVAVTHGSEFPILAQKQGEKHVKVTLGNHGEDIKLVGRNTWYLWRDHFQFITDSHNGNGNGNEKTATLDTDEDQQEKLADQVVRVCQERGYPLREDQWNLVGISGLSPQNSREQGYKIDTTPDRWNDAIGVIAYEDGDWDFLCLYLATTEPGQYYTVNPLNGGGAARLDLGYHKNLWRFGLHRGYEALVQAGTARLVRDANKNYRRDDRVTFEQGNGVNLHTTKTAGWQGSANKNSIGHWSAGCNVIYDPQEFKDLMALLKRSPQYKQNPQTCFDYRLLWYEWLH